MLDIKVTDIYVNQIDAVLKGNNIEIDVDTNTYNINLAINYDKFIELADKMRAENGEKTYTELEDAYLIMECQLEEKEEYIDALKEVNDDLRRR